VDGTGFGIDSITFDTDPADSLVWTEAKIEAIEVGFKLTDRVGFIDGFDHYNEIRRKWNVGNTADVPTFVAGRFGGQALKIQFQNSAGSINQNLGIQAELFIGFAFFAPGINTENQIEFKDSLASVKATLFVNSDGSITLNVSGSAADESSGAGVITQSQYAYIELHYHPSTTAGIFECRVDEVVVATITGDTTNGADDDVQSVFLSHDGSNNPRYLFDDFYILNALGAENTGYLGDVRVSTLYPTANGNTNNFTATPTSTNFEAVDEVILDDDTTFLESGILLAEEDYVNQDFDDLGVSPGTVFCVQTTNAAKKTDAGTIKYKDEMIIAGVRFDDGTEVTPGSGDYFCTTFIRNTDPSDGLPWTEAKVAAVGSGFTITFREI